ncbi:MULTISPECIES: M6 family metalloprotease domain-containing protein [Actinomycetes]|uniref:M6 family metalloprotease domain-containing protein n=1 Tax=Actinomycetes TaxID=1760 RepID=UPI0001B55A16|nr:MULTISPECIES: M6 family metalloprotease domain-containing protein [Actinomycetes]
MNVSKRRLRAKIAAGVAGLLVVGLLVGDGVLIDRAAPQAGGQPGAARADGPVPRGAEAPRQQEGRPALPEPAAAPGRPEVPTPSARREAATRHGTAATRADGEADFAGLDDRPSPAEQVRRQAAADKVERELSAVADSPAGHRSGPAAASGSADPAPGTAESLKAVGTHKVFVLAVEFGDDTTPAIGGPAGPVHNQIPRPDPKKDNSTYWVPDFDRQHYQDVFFGDRTPSFKDFYRQQSQGRFGVTGSVTEWIKLPHSEAYYNNVDYGELDQLIADGMNGWVANRKAAGWSDAQIKAELATFDTWSRASRQDKPDGRIDHLTIIHAGVGAEATGVSPDQTDDPRYRDNIWSHSSEPLDPVDVGGTGISAADYTIEPENAGVGVIAHEFGHDLGLPDLYDTVGETHNTAGFWSIMDKGSWLSDSDTAIGTAPSGFGPWEKLMLGWVDYTAVRYGEGGDVALDASDAKQGDNPQALVVILPKGPDGKGRYYLAENRRYTGYNADLRRAYFRSDPDGSVVQRFGYEPGMLLWYWNRSYTDNKMADHPGAGQVIPIDAHPDQISSDDGRAAPVAVQMYDAAFTLTPTPALDLRWLNRNEDNIKYQARISAPSAPAQPVFDDRLWAAKKLPGTAVAVPDTGTSVTLAGEALDGGTVTVRLAFTKPAAQ